MSKIEWQAYLDGSLSASEMREAEQVLKDDPLSRARVENLKAFVAEIKRQGLTQEVPLARLHKSIPSTRRFAWPRLLAPALATAAVIGVVYVVATRESDPGIIVVQDQSIPEGTAVASYQEASNWIQQANGIVTKPVQLASVQIVGAERTKTGGCYCVQAPDGQIVHLAFSKGSKPTPDLKPKMVDGHQFLASSKSVVFDACGVMWICHGGNEELRWAVAREAAKQLL